MCERRFLAELSSERECHTLQKEAGRVIVLTLLPPVVTHLEASEAHSHAGDRETTLVEITAVLTRASSATDGKVKWSDRLRSLG